MDDKTYSVSSARAGQPSAFVTEVQAGKVAMVSGVGAVTESSVTLVTNTNMFFAT